MMALLDIAFVRAALAARATELAMALLGEPNRAMSSKRELRFGRRGSLAVVVSGPKAGMWHDHQLGMGGDMLGLILRERGGSFADAARFAEEFVGQAPRRPVLSPRPVASSGTGVDAERNTRVALDIWQRATPITGTIAARYLAGRGLEVPPNIDGPTLRFHLSCPYRGARQPCMVALLRDIITDAPRAIQRTALSGDGGKIGRMTLGPKAGAAIKLSADIEVADRLTIGEGLETTLAGMMLGYAPAWALGDAGELATFPVLTGVESITILVDHDISGTGQEAALRCSARWTSAGKGGLPARAAPARGRRERSAEMRRCNIMTANAATADLFTQQPSAPPRTSWPESSCSKSPRRCGAAKPIGTISSRPSGHSSAAGAPPRSIIEL